MTSDPHERLVLADQVHERHELAWATVGTLRITVGRTIWTLGGDRALWIPAGTPHEVTVDAGSLALPAWFEVATCPLAWSRPTEVELSPDLRDHLHRHHQRNFSGVADDPTSTDALLTLIARQATRLLPPLVPSQPQARVVATTLLRDPADRRTLADWADELYVASKTLQRAFVAETGRTFSRWRTEVRLAAALPLLADGRDVGAVSRTVGYDTPGGFIAAYRRRFGHTPTAYRADRARHAS